MASAVCEPRSLQIETCFQIGSTMPRQGCRSNSRYLSYGSSRGELISPSFSGSGIKSNVANFSDQTCGPTINIVFANILAHSVHAHLLFLGAHFKSGTDRL